MKKWMLIIYIFTIAAILNTVNNYPDFIRHIEKTNQALKGRATMFDQYETARLSQTRNMECYDVEYYFIDVNIGFEEQYIVASVLMRFELLEANVSQIEINFANTLTIDTVTSNGSLLEYTHEEDIITVILPELYEIGEILEMEIAYFGNPVNRLNDGMKFREHAGIPVVFTMVSPMGARKWWPCKDTPSDKADSLDIRLTYPSQYISASNGTLIESTDNGNGTKTDIWHESYSIATYLTSFAITNYDIYLQTYTFQDQEMDIVHHVYPEQYNVTTTLYEPTPQMLDFFSTVYGPYPFLNEKYGHATCTDLGALAMEHQTCTSFDAGYISDPEAEYTVAHELAHQWTGDFLTIGNWEHVWLKEGFARYSEALWAEHLFGYEALLDYMDVLDNGSPLDPALQRDPEGSGNDIFNIVIYSKGAWTQHMLRGVIGDDDYFDAVQNLMADPQFMYGNFFTEDLENAAENVSEMELDWFFDQWFLQEGRPSYNYTVYTAPASENSRVTIESLPFQDNYFSMYIPYEYEDLTDRLFAEGGINHLILPVEGNTHTIEWDPENWVLDYGFTEKLPELEDIEVRNGNIGLAWSEFFDPDIDGFNIYRAISGEQFVKINNETIAENFYFDEDLEIGISYQYKITAVYDAVFESGFSNMITMEPIDYSFDLGILLVDNSGDFASPFPSDEEIDSFYYYLLEDQNFTEWDVADSDYPPLNTIASYSTVIWHSDDILFNPLIDNFFSLKNYLTAGGNLFLSNCRSLEELDEYDLNDFLAIQSSSLNNNDDFIGATGLEDYPDIILDVDKIPMPTWDNAFANIYKFQAATAGDVIYTFDSASDDPEWEGEPCAIRKLDHYAVITLGFPLYFMQETCAYDLMQQVLIEFGEITGSEDDLISGNADINLTNYPNPFNPSTLISFDLTAKDAMNVKLEIFNQKGQRIRTLTVPSTPLRLTQAGRNLYSVLWDGSNDFGQPVPSGIYFYRLETKDFEQTKKMLLLK